MICSQCQKEVSLTDKISFREDCPHCSADLHTCLNCRFYDTHAYNECQESSADRVLEKEKANLCEYFQPGNKLTNESSAEDEAKKKLEALFK